MEKIAPKLPSPLWCKGYTPAECTSYITYKHPKYPEKDTTLCCLRSHIKALKHFLENSEKEFVLILEDDILLTTDFTRKLENVIACWDKHSAEIDFVTIGFNPGNYASKKSDAGLYWDLYCEGGAVWGMLAYLMKRAVVEDLVKVLDQPTTHDLYQVVERKIKENGGRIYCPKLLRAQSDAIFSMCWRQAFVKPILVIESPMFNSTISPEHSNSNTRGWNSAFQKGELKVEDFDPCCELYLRM
jgi:GR25 family glycosyltransferase involved in LPS biosynthesis